MMDVDFSSFDLDQPAERRRLLKTLSPDRETARRHHADLRDLLRREMAYGASDAIDDEGYYENMYWCALFLYLVGDVTDAPILWVAKNIDFDTYCGMDVQFLVGAGVDATVSYLKEVGYNDAVEYLESCGRGSYLDWLDQWEASRIEYYYYSEARL